MKPEPQIPGRLGRLAYSIPESCVVTGLGRDAVYAAIRRGHLVARKVGRRTVIPENELRRFLATRPKALKAA